MTFDLARLKPGDEVGIEIRRTNRVTQEISVCQSAGIVVEVADDGHICLEGDEWYSPSGKYLFEAWGERQLCSPTDEGRLACLQESIYADLSQLQDKARSMPLDRLRELRETVLELLKEAETRAEKII